MITFSKHSKIVIAIIAVASLFNFTVYAETTDTTDAKTFLSIIDSSNNTSLSSNSSIESNRDLRVSVETDEKSIHISKQKVDTIKKNTLQISYSVNDFMYEERIENVDALKEKIKSAYPKIDNYELGKAVLISLGDTEELIDTLPKEKVIEAIDYQSVVKTEIYLSENEDGELKKISKKDFAKSKSKSTSSTYSGKNTYGDLVLKSSAYKRTPNYALSGRNYFTIRGEVEWIGYPNFQFQDLLVISSTGNIDNKYSHYAGGVWSHNMGTTIKDTAYLSKGKGKYISISTPSLYGIGAKFPIGVGQQGKIIVDKVYCYYGVSSQKDISCQVSYAHGILSWNPSFSVSSGGTVSFGGVSIRRQTFFGTAFTLYHS